MGAGANASAVRKYIWGAGAVQKYFWGAGAGAGAVGKTPEGAGAGAGAVQKRKLVKCGCGCGTPKLHVDCCIICFLLQR